MRSAVLAALLAGALVPLGAAAQGRPTPRWEIKGLDFRPDGVWRRQARAVRRTRAALLSQGAFATLNAPMAAGAPQPSPQAVSGLLRVPAIRFQYANVTAPYTNADYDQVLFAATPPSGRPYTYHTYYDQLSNHLLDIEGQTFGPAPLASNEVTYTGGTSSTCQANNPFGSMNCNGLFSNSAFAAMQNGLREALSKLDGTIDFSQYDSDGDGYVDLAVFIQPALGGECGPSGNPQNHIWSHRSSLGPQYVTNDLWPGHPGQFIKVADYIVEGAVGGNSACNASQIMPIGTVAHETGHGFGLPDLYDTGGSTEGIGEYSLMSSGNYTTGLSPSRMDAWSLNQLGWVTLAPIASSNSYSFGPAGTGVTAFIVRPTGANPRGEYFLLENRQPLQSDSAMLRYHCKVSGVTFPTPCHGGLIIYHVDSVQIAQHGFNVDNRVNTGPIHGLELLQADGLGNLDVNPSAPASNRGDGGDEYPGITNNPRFSFATTPSAQKNVDGSFIGFGVDSLRETVTDSVMRFYLQFGNLTVVQPSDPGARILFDGVNYAVFKDMLDSLSLHTVSVPADTSFSSDGRTRYRFASWSDGLPKTHTITGKPAGDTITANYLRDRQLVYTPINNKGHVTASPPDTSGSFVAESTQVTLTATVDSAGYNFGGWFGDTTATGNALVLGVRHPDNVHGSFH